MTAVTSRETTETPVDSRRAKLAGSVAGRILEDVIELGWPVGTVIGSEAELVERYGVSRAVFREAIRLVEHQHVARMRRGPGGGLVVDEPDADAVISASVLYLLRVNARLDEVFDARVVLEEIVAEIAPGRMRPQDVDAVRGLVAAEQSAGTAAGRSAMDHRRLHTLLASATGNPVLQLFVDCLNRLAGFYFADPNALSDAALAESVRAHERIAAAVLADDPALARRRMRRHLAAEADFIRHHAGTSQVLPTSAALGSTLGNKRAERVARSIFTDIVESAVAPGAFVGSESVLMERHRASRAILREAVRILEHHDIVLMRRGPRGGLFVAPPSAAAVAEIVTIYLRRNQVSAKQLAEARAGVEVALVQRAADRLRRPDKNEIRRALASETRSGQAGSAESRTADGRDNLHLILASLAGNRALELVAFVLIRLANSDFSGRFPNGVPRPALQDIQLAHRAIGEALIAGDTESAIGAMRAHLVGADPGGASH